MPSTLTPLRYPGGKSKYRDLFIDIIQANEFHNRTFVEVFAGGAGAAISLLLKKQVQSIILNDLDPAIYSFWRSVKEHPQELVKKIENTAVSIKEWKRQKKIYDKKDLTDTVTLGFATFYLNRCNHSGILEARPIGGMDQDGDYPIDARYNKKTSITKINSIAEYADVIQLYNLECKTFLRMLKKDYSDNEIFVYFDPPYFQKGPDLYLNYFEKQDHEILRDEITDCSFPWILSYDHHKEIIDLYKDSKCHIRKNKLRHTITGNTSARELIISKLELPDYLRHV